jgi:subtilisin
MRVTKAVLGLFAIAALCLIAAAAVHAEGNEPVRKIVVFDASVPAAERVRVAQASGGRVIRELPMINAVVVEAHPGVMAACETRLHQSPSVMRVDADPKINWLLSQTMAPALPAMPAFKFAPARPKTTEPPTTREIPWGIQRVNAPAAWSTTRGQGVKVVVIDTGIDYDHPNLKANVKGGWNAITKKDDFRDDNGHGSHCSGTIAGVDGATGVVGVAPKVDLYGVKVLDADGSGTFDDVIAGMQWAVDHHMQVASMSLGASQGNDSLKAAVAAMVKGGVVLIAAAGNSGSTVGYPAAYAGAIAIAAMDSSDKVAYFSSRGPEVALIAPGVDVKSTYKDGGYDTLSGTSMATPHVSGLAALAIAAKGVSGYEGVRAALAGAASPLKDVPVTQQGAGVVDAAKLVR